MDKTIDVGIHSMKDMPASDENPELKVICWMKRYDASDAHFKLRKKLEQLPSGSIIGTSSVRRRAQILNFRQDLQIKLLRGNVDTRIQKLIDKQYDGIILSLAGLKDRSRPPDHRSYGSQKILACSLSSAVGVQAKINNDLQKVFKPINHYTTQIGHR